MGTYNATPATIPDGGQRDFRINARGALIVQGEDASGNPGMPISGSQTEDAPSADGASGVAVLAVRQDTPANTSGTDGDYEFLKMSGGKLATSAYAPPLPAGTDRSGTATTTSGGLNVAANASRTFLTGQNIGTVNIGFNELAGTAAIGTAGTWTVAPGATFKISTNRQINIIAASGTCAVTMTEG